jgi:Zn-dependent M16 (insulinase) family peptidase
LTLESDPKYIENVLKKEETLIETLGKNLTDEDKARIVKQALQLKKEQEAPQDLSLLPTLTPKDIPVLGEPTHFSQDSVEGMDVFYFEKPVNGVTHLRIKFRLDNIDSSILPQFYLISQMFSEIGTKDHSYEDFDELLQLHSTGVNFQIHYDGQYLDRSKIDGFAILSISCLDRNITKMIELVTELLAEHNFKDREHVAKLIRLASSSAANKIVDSPLEFAIDYGVSSNCPARQFYNKLETNRFLCNFGTGLSRGLDSKMVLEDLEMSIDFAFQKLIKKSNMSFSVHTAPQNRETVNKEIKSMAKALKSKYYRFEKADPVLNSFEYTEEYYKDYFVIPTQTNYVTETVFVPQYSHPDSPVIEVLSELLSRGELHKLIREKGGAYGSGAKFSSLSGALSFFSYRDPQALETLENFRIACRTVAEGKITAEDIDSAKLSLFSKIDVPVMSQNHGQRQFYYGITDKEAAVRRNLQLNCSKAQLLDSLNKYVLPALEQGRSSKVIFGMEQENKDVLTKENWKLESFSAGLQLRLRKYQGTGEEESGFASL